jgi:hypothetical protein
MNTDDFLMHHGIKGQKWGVRRFQNEDGSLTSAGKRRLAQTSDSDTRDRLVRGHDTSVRLAKEYADDAKKHAKQLKFGQAYADRRLSKESARKAARNARKIAKIDDKAEADARKAIKDQRKHYAKNASLLSDAELNAQISRLQREKQLKNPTSEVVTPGRYKAKQMVHRYGSQVLSAAVGGVATGIGMRYVNAFMDKNLAKQGFKVKGYNADGTPNYGENKKDD